MGDTHDIFEGTTDTENTTTALPGESLRAKIEVPLQERRWWFWIGLSPKVGRDWVHIKGVSFVKSAQTPLKGPFMRKTEWVRHRGALVPLSATELRNIAEALPNHVLRPVEKDSGGTSHAQLKIPTDEYIAAARRRGRIVPPYVPRPGDEPLADFIWCVPLAAAEVAAGPMHKSIDTPPPPMVSETGINLPDDSVPTVEIGATAKAHANT